MDKLSKKIEKERTRMIALAQTHSMTSETVIRASRELDQLINDYQRKKLQAKTLQPHIKEHA
ncbi:MAG TPA: aspartyl-phosphate phosphatase Spo0E family protein [Bacillota bacterium]|nr:aspartyl-phosphate phosphatase Spo0E family protein [Bacillota bacterium]